jgi:hypothetical protein
MNDLINIHRDCLGNARYIQAITLKTATLANKKSIAEIPVQTRKDLSMRNILMILLSICIILALLIPISEVGAAVIRTVAQTDKAIVQYEVGRSTTYGLAEYYIFLPLLYRNDYQSPPSTPTPTPSPTPTSPLIPPPMPTPFPFPGFP